jgi:hypothetical protein
MLALSLISTTQLLLPANNDNTSLLNIIAYIRDMSNCVTEYNMPSILVISDMTEIDIVINTVQNSNNEMPTNSFVQMLASGNQNIVNQVITSFSSQFNAINNQALQTAVISKYIIII